MLRVQSAPFAARERSKDRRVPPLVETARDESIDEREALLPLVIESLMIHSHVLRRGRSAVRPGQLKEHEFENWHGEGRLVPLDLNVAERRSQNLIAVPEHLVDRHLSPASRGVRRQGLHARTNRGVHRGVVKQGWHGGWSWRLDGYSDPSCRSNRRRCGAGAMSLGLECFRCFRVAAHGWA